MTNLPAISWYLAFTFVLAGISLAIEQAFYPAQLLIPKYWVIFGSLATITGIAYVFSFSGLKKSGVVSVYITLGSLVIKMVFSMTLAMIYLTKFKVNAVLFASNFVTLYFLFSIFEVYSLLRTLRDQNKT